MTIYFQDAETFLTYNWIQDDILETLFGNLPRVSFFKLCRMVHFAYAESYTGNFWKCSFVATVLEKTTFLPEMKISEKYASGP